MFTLSIATAGLATAFDKYPSVVIAVEALVALCIPLLFIGALRGGFKAALGSRAPMALVCVIGATGICPALEGPVTFPGNRTYWVVAHLIFVLLVINAFRLPTTTVRASLRALMVLSLVGIFAGASAFSFDERVLLPLPGRLTGTLGHPNVTGPAAALLFIMAMRERRLRKTDAAIALAVLSATLSFTTLIALGLAVVAYLGRTRTVRGGIAVLAWILPMAPWAMVTFAPDLVPPDLFTGRGRIWRWVVEMRAQSPHAEGIGIFDQIRHSSEGLDWFHAHNEFLMDLLTGGWTLAVLTSVISGIVGLAAYRSGDRGSLAIWCLISVGSMTEVPLFLDYPGARVYLISLVAITALRHRLSPTHSVESESREHRSVLA